MARALPVISSFRRAAVAALWSRPVSLPFWIRYVVRVRVPSSSPEYWKIVFSVKSSFCMFHQNVFLQNCSKLNCATFR